MILDATTGQPATIASPTGFAPGQTDAAGWSHSMVDPGAEPPRGSILYGTQGPEPIQALPLEAQPGPSAPDPVVEVPPPAQAP